MAWPAKDPNEILDYSWAVPLDDGDTIAAHTAAVVSGTVTIAVSSVMADKVVAWITGGADGETALIEITATTQGGRKFETTQPLQIVSSAYVAQFVAAFPAFIDTPRQTLTYWYKQAEAVVDERYGTDRGYATMLLAADMLTRQGQGVGGEAQRLSKFGGATQAKSGTLSLSWDGADSKESFYKQTSYGKLFWPYMRLHAGGPLVTNTGALPEHRHA
ncbi:MAG: DUF4054 domain-containing protein [Shewanella sp.]